MQENKVYDIIGIGIGPFNLGLAAILKSLPELTSLFLDENPEFNWHPGLLLPDARMQVPFYADLVTILNPESPFTFTNYLQKNKKLFRFANLDNNFPLRIEYNAYCRWVVSLLDNLLFGEKGQHITWNEEAQCYTVDTTTKKFHAKHIVLGTGTQAFLPECLQKLTQKQYLHSSDYLNRKEDILKSKRVTLLGSGQSAAEVFKDLLQYADNFESLTWFTKESRLTPMDTSAFAAELTCYDYVDYFYALHRSVKPRIIHQQQHLFKGINTGLIAEISEALYMRSILQMKPTPIHTNCMLTNAKEENNKLTLQFFQREEERCFDFETDILISATGYEYKTPGFLLPLTGRIQWDDENKYRINRDYSIDREHSIFLQNADLYSHGFNAADLGLGPYRNGTIINSILKREVFGFETQTTFQQFSIPSL